MIEIKDKLLALDFDTACTLRLLMNENERENARFERLATMLGGSPKEEELNVKTETW